MNECTKRIDDRWQRKIVFTCSFMLFFTSIIAQNQVILDERVDEWEVIPIRYQDPVGDGINGSIDFDRFWISNDDQYLYLRIEVGSEINFQSTNDLALYIDIDNNPDTGFPLNGIGADLRYFPGLRFGYAHIGSQILDVRHIDIGMISSPTVSSDDFEIAIKRSSEINGLLFEMGMSIRIAWQEDMFAGDRLPDENGGLLYQMSDDIMQLPEVQLGKAESSHLRIISHNVLQDGIFEPGRMASFERLLKAVKPDIIGFQEIYNHNAASVQNFVSEVLPGNDWFSQKRIPDIIIVSKYPIVNSHSLNGNGVFLLDLGTHQLLIIVAHLPCCDNEIQRQEEADKIIQFILNMKAGIGPFPIAHGTPIVVTGDMNLVGLREQQQTLLTGSIVNTSVFGPGGPPDWDDTNFEDAVPMTTGFPASATWIQPFSSFSPGRLDYILYSGSVMQLEKSYALNTEGLTPLQLSQNNLQVFDSFNASDHLVCVADFSLDIQTNTKGNLSERNPIRIFPNPVTSLLYLETLDDVITNTEFSISDLMGRTILKNNLEGAYQDQNTYQLDVSSLAEGWYTLTIGNFSTSFIKK